MQLRELDPVLLSRELERLNQQRRAWERRLESDPSLADAPLALQRGLLGREAWESVASRPAADPLREPLLRWLFLLIERRVNHSWRTRAALELRSELVQLTEPRRAELCRGELLTRALHEPPARASWLARLAENAPPLSRTTAIVWQRRRALAERLGAPGLDQLELPNPSAATLAQRWLDRTRALALEFPCRSLAEYLGQSLCTDAERGWPTRINERMFLDWFQEGGLLRDLEPELGTLPEPLGAASYARALLSFGHAFRLAAASTRQPFVIAHDPYGLEAAQHGYLFAALLTEASFLTRKLRLAAVDAADTRRVLARAWLLEARWQAFKVTLRQLASTSYERLLGQFEELSHAAFGFVLPRTLALVVPRLAEDDAQHFVGSLLAQRRLAELREAHDADWFRNPRAADQLRSEAALSPETKVDDEALELGLDATARELESLLGR